LRKPCAILPAALPDRQKTKRARGCQRALVF